jgi:hypothetical protein
VGLEYTPEHPVSEGSLCPKCTNEENYLLQKLARLLGTNNVDQCARLCHAPTAVGLARAFGSGAMTNPIPDLANADCIFIIGSNLAENHALVARWVLRAKDKGARVIAADPRLTPTAWLADTFLPIRPGSDVALLNDLMHIVIEEGLTDQAFIQRTSGYDELIKVVQDYTPDHVPISRAYRQPSSSRPTAPMANRPRQPSSTAWASPSIPPAATTWPPVPIWPSSAGRWGDRGPGCGPCAVRTTSRGPATWEPWTSSTLATGEWTTPKRQKLSARPGNPISDLQPQSQSRSDCGRDDGRRRCG